MVVAVMVAVVGGGDGGASNGNSWRTPGGRLRGKDNKQKRLVLFVSRGGGSGCQTYGWSYVWGNNRFSRSAYVREMCHKQHIRVYSTNTT